MIIWNPWHGCTKYSTGCKYCYIQEKEKKNKTDPTKFYLTKNFDLPIRKYNNEYFIKANDIVYICFNSDFLLPAADKWRNQCWQMIKTRNDLKFIFISKRISRLKQCLPVDWGVDYDHVAIGCTAENQELIDQRLEVFKDIPIKEKYLILQPLLEEVSIAKYLYFIDEVIVGGEEFKQGRILNYDWVRKIHHECKNQKTNFIFRQCSTNFIRDQKFYHLSRYHLMRQARKANINLKY